MDRFHDEQEGLDSEGYRAISKTSVMAFVLGLLSFTAPVFPAFWIFPLFGLGGLALLFHLFDLGG